MSGADLTDVAVERLRERFRGDTFTQFDLTGIAPNDLPAGSLTTRSSAMDVLQHIVDDEGDVRAIENLHALLRRGGMLIMTENLVHGAWYRSDHQVVRDIDWILGLLDRTGFEVVRQADVHLVNSTGRFQQPTAQALLGAPDDGGAGWAARRCGGRRGALPGGARPHRGAARKSDHRRSCWRASATSDPAVAGRRLSIAVIPARYPMRERPFAGVFVRDHALAAMLDDDVVIVADDGPDASVRSVVHAERRARGRPANVRASATGAPVSPRSRRWIPPRASLPCSGGRAGRADPPTCFTRTCTARRGQPPSRARSRAGRSS